jgi:hypothetical protein
LKGGVIGGSFEIYLSLFLLEILKGPVEFSSG